MPKVVKRETKSFTRKQYYIHNSHTSLSHMHGRLGCAYRGWSQSIWYNEAPPLSSTAPAVVVTRPSTPPQTFDKDIMQYSHQACMPSPAQGVLLKYASLNSCLQQGTSLNPKQESLKPMANRNPQDGEDIYCSPVVAKQGTNVSHRRHFKSKEKHRLFNMLK